MYSTSTFILKSMIKSEQFIFKFRIITLYFIRFDFLSQIRYSLVVILGLNSVSGVQYKGMMTDR